jgi:hypothetical protein
VASVYLSSEEVTLADKQSGVSSVYKSSEEYYKCDPCINAGDHVEAEGFCTDCNEYLCSTCFRSHSGSRLSKHHVLLSKDGMPIKSTKFCNPCKIAGVEIKAVGYCKDEYTFIQDINVKSDTDGKDCYITDMTLVSDNELVLGDYDNQGLKLVDINKNIIKDILALQSRPFGITTISNDQ